MDERKIITADFIYGNPNLERMGKVYACPGTCHGIVTEEEFIAGAKTCNTESCDFHGKPLEPRDQCDDCAEKTASDGKPHVCEDCE